MKANQLTLLVLFLVLGSAGAQEQTVKTPTNTTELASAANSAIVLPPRISAKPLEESVNAQKFWPENLKEWIGILQALSVIAASIVAWRGISAWRREFVGKRRIELAEESLALFYQAEEIIAWMRSPWTLSLESSKRKPEFAESPRQKEINDAVYVFSKRFDSDLFSRIRAIRYRVMALFGKESSNPFNELKSVLDQLQIALSAWARLSGVDTSKFKPDELGRHKADIQKHEKVLWNSEKDQISSHVEGVVGQIERICRLHLDHRG